MLVNARSALAVIVLVCIFIKKYYTEIFRVVYKGKVSSFQYKLSLVLSSSMREAHGPSLILIDRYVPALTPRLH